MEAPLYKTENPQWIEVEIYETGEKTRIAANKLIVNQRKDRSIIITAAEYKSLNG